MAEFHHGISKKEPTSGIIPMRDTDTNVIGLIAFSDDADQDIFPLDTPTLVTSINRALAASGTEGNLRASLETMSAITSPTLVVIRIQDPFKGEVFNQSLVIGSTSEAGQRTGIQALLTAKSILGITPKINIAPDVETPEVVQALAAVNKKLRAFSYVTPRDQYGVMLETMQMVTAYRNTLSDREIMLIWPEFTSRNVFDGCAVSLEASCQPSSFKLPELPDYGWANSANGIMYSINDSSKKALIYGSTGTTSSIIESFKNLVLYANMSDQFNYEGYGFDSYFFLNESDSALGIKGNNFNGVGSPITVKFYPLTEAEEGLYDRDMYWDMWRSTNNLDPNASIPSAVDYSKEFIELHSCGVT